MDKTQATALVAEARAAREHAYAPYSNFRVGATVLLRDGQMFSGVNVENCSYGLTVCAERHAIAAAVLGGAGRGDVVGVAIVAGGKLTPPCGACRQTLFEFGAAETPVILAGEAGEHWDETTLGVLLPNAFTPSRLNDEE